MDTEGLSVEEVLRLASVIATSMIHLFAAACSYYLERRTRNPPMFALLFFLFAWCTLTLGSATSGVGRFFPAILVGAPFLSGYIGPALFIYTKQLTAPQEKVRLSWLWFGIFGTIHSCMALMLPDGLDPAIQSIIHKTPYMHPILSPILMIHGAQLIAFVLISTFLITRTYVNKGSPDLRKTQFWLLTVCWTCVVIIVFTNILPTFKVIVTEIQPALITLPIAIVGALSIKALGEESRKEKLQITKERNIRMDSLGRMARGMAHDLNNVLSTILGHAEIAKMKTQSTGSTMPHLDQIIFGTRRAAILIERMLTYSGKPIGSAKVIDPSGRLKSLFESVATLQPSTVSMQLEMAQDLPKIQIDETELDGAIQNLLQNGLNAMQHNKGKITLKASFDQTTNLPQDYIGHDLQGVPCLRVEVEDTGRGMSTEEASRALEPFFSTQPNGKGLGLVNVLSMVKGAGGALWFQSEMHLGTRFVFWIPQATEHTAEERKPSQPSLANLNVLLVEDDNEVATVLQQILRSMTIQIKHYQSSEDVLASLNDQTLPNYDIAILDIRLGEIDGIELGHHLLTEQKVDSLLFISADAPGQRIQQFSSNNVHFLRKPVGMDQIRMGLNTLMQV